MSIVSKTYLANGSNKIFSSDFKVLSDSHLEVTVGGVMVSKSDYDLINNAAVFNVAPALNSTVVVRVGTTPDDLLTDNTDIEIVSESIADVNTLADNINDINSVATNIASIQDVTDNMSDINIIADIGGANLQGIVDNIENISTVANIYGSVSAVAAVADAVVTTATNIASVNTAATNIATLNSVVSNVVPNMAEILLADDNAATATTKAAQALTSAGNAATSEANALASKNTTLGYMTTTEGYKNTTSGYMATTEGYKNNASASATTASTQAGIATTKAGEASTSAGNAMTYRDTAGTYATTATTQASNALTSANNADTSEANALTYSNNALASANAADVSEANALTYAGNALTSANNATSSLSTFNGKYVSSATEPNSPTEGMLWYDTVNNLMKVYGDSGWANAGSSVNGTSSRNTYTATAGQTTFSSTYDAGYVDVYRNGLKLATSDFTASNGTTVVLNNACSLNDVVDIVAYGTFELADAYTKNETNVLLAAKANLASPTFTGTPLSTTAVVGTNTTQIATTAFVQSLLSTTYFDISTLFAGSVTTLNVPQILCKVNGTLVSISAVNVDINATTYWDNTTYATPANRNGKDFYVYVLSDGSLKLSINSTYPTGSDANNSRKVGGFHTLCNSVGTISGHTLTGYVTGNILPRSVWDLYNRASAGNAGMVKSLDGYWIDIYLPSWNGSQLVSSYGATIADGVSSPAFHSYKFEQQFGMIGKAMVSQVEFVVASLGSNQSTNVTGSNDKGTTGGWTDTAGRRMISNIGCEDMCGFMWQWCRDTGGLTSGASWVNAYDGNDSGVGGQHYEAPLRGLFGGYWSDGVICGSRGSWWAYSPLGLSLGASSRGRSEAAKNRLI